LPAFVESKLPWCDYAAAIASYHDLLSRQFKKEVEKRKPSMYLAYLAKQMQIRARVMFDATRLLAEKQDCTEFFTFAHDDEMPFKADDSEANNLLGLAGQVLRTYEVGKLISMGYRQEAIYAVLD
jgi:hypothetical protein